jgi:hypothetical protein
VVDAVGNPPARHLTGGEASCQRAHPDTAQADHAHMDRKRERRVREMHSARHLVENFCCEPKPFRGIATRYDKTKRNFLAAVYAAAAILLN